MLSQSISDLYNKRDDKYRADDFLLLKQVFECVKNSVKVPVGVKLQCDDFADNCGMNADKALKILRAIPFDFVEISGGGSGEGHKHITIRPRSDGLYYYKHVLQRLSSAGVKTPLIVTGGMTVENAAEAIADGAALVGFCRQFVRDDRFLLNGCANQCVRCNQCNKRFLERPTGIFCPITEAQEAREKKNVE